MLLIVDVVLEQRNRRRRDGGSSSALALLSDPEISRRDTWIQLSQSASDACYHFPMIAPLGRRGCPEIDCEDVVVGV